MEVTLGPLARVARRYRRSYFFFLPQRQHPDRPAAAASVLAYYGLLAVLWRVLVKHVRVEVGWCVPRRDPVPFPRRRGVPLSRWRPRPCPRRGSSSAF